MADDDSDLSATEPEKVNTAWMLTFADLLSLVLCFFVMMYAMSVLEINQFEQMSQSLNERINPDKLRAMISYQAPKSITKTQQKMAIDLDYLNSVLEKKMRDADTLRQVRLTRQEDRLVISLASDSLFGTGDAHLSQESQPMVFAISEMLGSIGNRIEVDGHTDPTPSKSELYPSNWELSLSRAVTIANALRNSGYSSTINVHGLADRHYQEISSSLAEAERMALSRRVDIVVRQTMAR